jgi:asparagine synthase (glutamine-hydrolysing)
LIPETVMHRKKAGFPVPLTAWMFGEWREFVYQTLLNSGLPNSKIYRSGVISKLFSAPPSQQRRAARLLWALLSLELWYGMNHGGQTDRIKEISLDVRSERWRTVAESL